ncbi:MAG: hypothetical protein R2780_07865 [Crocinitomicaceae bacterium]|nr:hypothetical protein [Crocinitomicaceae bacterium]
MKSFTFAALLLGAFALSSFTGNPDGDKPEKSEGKNIVHYRIELCSYKNTVPVRTAEALREVNGVLPIKTNGTYTYYSAPCATEIDAAKELEKFQQMGFNEAKQVVQYNGNFITVEEYHKINKSKSEVRIWK